MHHHALAQRWSNVSLLSGYKHRDHLLSRKIICACCGKKKLKCSMLEPGTQFLNLVQMYANSNYNPDLLCKVYLYSAKKGESLSIVTLENWLLTSERIRLLPRFKGDAESTCDCPLCVMSRDKSKEVNLKDVLSVYLNEPEISNEVIKKICFNCYQRIDVGIRHSCSKKDTVENLRMLLISKGLKTVEQVLSKSLKEIQQVQNIQMGEKVKFGRIENFQKVKVAVWKFC
nr:uncharacterized protein LOC124817545 [Hydra vulgaris]